MRIKRLNDQGLRCFEEYVRSVAAGDSAPPPHDVLHNPETSEDVEPPVEVEDRNFTSRYDAGKYLHDRLSEAGIPNLEKDRGLWAWLALFYFDRLCPRDDSGRRKPGELARWIPDVDNYRKYYRHLLAGPWRIFRAHRDDPNRALALLCTPVHTPGDLPEQLASRQELVTNKAIMQVATLLYVDPATKEPRSGARGKGPGSARRLADVLNQFDLTWDLYAMSADELLTMLPSEFNRFKPGTS